MKLSELHYMELLYETRQSIAAKDVNLVYYLGDIERRLAAGEEAVKKVAKLKQALRSSMNELLKDTVSPELQDYFDYVSELRNKIAELEKEVERLKATALAKHKEAL